MQNSIFQYDNSSTGIQPLIDSFNDFNALESTLSPYEKEHARMLSFLMEKALTKTNINQNIYTDKNYQTTPLWVYFDYEIELDTVSKIKTKVEKEFAKNSSYITSDLKKAYLITETLIEHLSSISFKDISLELTPSNAIKFKIILNNEQLITITKPFENLVDVNDNEVIFNFYLNNQRILSDVKDITELVYGINKISN